MSFEESVKESHLLFKVIEKSVKDTDDLNHLKCVEGDFIIYHAQYANLRPIRFFLHLLKSIFFVKNFSINYTQNNSVSEDKKVCDIATILTSEYLYNTTLKPVIDRLSNKHVKNTLLSIQYSRALSFFRTSNALSVSVSELFFKKKITIRHIFLVIYLKYILIPNCKRLNKHIRNSFNSKYSLIVTTEICDVFSRVFAMVAKSNNVEFIILQGGPLIKDTSIEIESMVSDYFLAWPESRNFLEKYPLNSDIKVKYFTSPRFYDTFINNKQKKYDVAFFLPWLDFTSPMKSIYDQIDLTLSTLEAKGLSVCIKLHPATDKKMENYILKTYKRFYFFSKVGDYKKLIMSSKMTVNFGSTVSYDADYMMIKTAIINLDRRLENDCVFFKLKYIKNITKIEDLTIFIENFNPKILNNEISLEAIEFIYSRVLLTNNKRLAK